MTARRLWDQSGGLQRNRASSPVKVAHCLFMTFAIVGPFPTKKLEKLENQTFTDEQPPTQTLKKRTGIFKLHHSIDSCNIDKSFARYSDCGISTPPTKMG
jgi:hypothetical protein